jgi:two-component system KDP operon response regulator KdpE
VRPTGARAHAADAAVRSPAAAIVELALPDADGVDLRRQLREWSAIPLIVLSAVDAEHQKVRGPGVPDLRAA